jgi:hypothetical protein
MVERVVLNALGENIAATPPDICAFDDLVCHRSEPDWRFQEKPIHPPPKSLDTLPLPMTKRNFLPVPAFPDQP